MSWKDLLEEGRSERVLPWFGVPRVHDADRSWTISGPLPPEHGWYKFEITGGRDCILASTDLQQPDQNWGMGQYIIYGYLVGDRIAPDRARVVPDVTKIIQQTIKVQLVEIGLELFSRACVARDRLGHLVFLSQEFPIGPEQSVIEAYQDRKEGVHDIPEVTPSLDLAFRWATYQRQRNEERRAELERLREEERRERERQGQIREAMRNAGTAVGRRALAARDFEAGAREALRVSGAELLDARRSRTQGEMVVQYRFRRQRFECVVERTTLRVIDAGVCLDDHHGTKGDTLFTLESLPGVIGEAMDLGVLHVWRHV